MMACGMWIVCQAILLRGTPSVTRYQAASCDECASESRTCTALECSCLCIHMYKCDSKSYTFNNGHICKHIHRVHSLSQVRSQDSTMEPIEEASTPDGIGQQCDSVDYAEPTSLV